MCILRVHIHQYIFEYSRQHVQHTKDCPDHFGCIFKRKISIDKETRDLSGCDELIRTKDGKPINYSIRFHLYPGLTAVKTMGGNSVLIQLSKNKSLLFTIANESVLVEKSIFLGGNKILNSLRLKSSKIACFRLL
mgnify:CR=1 FL=1